MLGELARVPYGEVTTYGTLAAAWAGPLRAGGRDGHEPQSDPDRVPCHRVVGSNGSLVGYAGGLDRKQALLRLEGASLL